MGMTLEQAQQAIGDAATVYTVDGTGVVLIQAGTDNNGVDYAAYLVADPDDNEAVRYTEDLAWLHLRQQVTTKRLTDPCMCEHTNHFDDEYGPRVDGAHIHMDVPAAGYEALYVGSICAWCAVSCMADYLI